MRAESTWPLMSSLTTRVVLLKTTITAAMMMLMISLQCLSKSLPDSSQAHIHFIIFHRSSCGIADVWGSLTVVRMAHEDSDADEEGEAPNAGKNQGGRKRGRAMKNAVAGPSEDVEEAPAKRRGRPSKNAATRTSAPDASTANTSAIRRPGRIVAKKTEETAGPLRRSSRAAAGAANLQITGQAVSTHGRLISWHANNSFITRSRDLCKSRSLCRISDPSVLVVPKRAPNASGLSSTSWESVETRRPRKLSISSSGPTILTTTIPGSLPSTSFTVSGFCPST
ncbi:hypothetical protein F4778DRAFT_309498 [Xylariomycetidae sp. FL2044]|nr:hypothetical protein F4778DRAFT_309498 [Xylariomycetidae sp. FL2044]